jgi:short subunit dehydrogenase-like uncharacterized protein
MTHKQTEKLKLLSMADQSFLLYGANGYTGRLIAKLAAEYHLSPILAGRSKAPIEKMAKELNLPSLVIDLDDDKALTDALSKLPLVLHAAGPFDKTAKQMADACIKTGTHYLDINGDISVFEMLKKYHDAAISARVMFMPGVGFDVVPTDCLALKLKHIMPDATKLELAFATIGGSLSHGTAFTMAGKLGEGGAVRKNGKIMKVPLGAKAMMVHFFTGNDKPDLPFFVMNIPWGDVSTAYTTTGIPNIETYVGVPKKAFYFLKAQFLFNWILRMEYVRNKIKRKIDAGPSGPTDTQRQRAKGMVWGRATNEAGETVTAKLCGPEGYTITAHAALIIINKILHGQFEPGYQTPAKVYGADLICEVPGIEMEKTAIITQKNQK